MAEAQKKETYIKKVIESLEKRHFTDIRSKLESFEDPKSFKQTSTNTTLTPDITATSSGKKYYFDIALKTEAKDKVINKWKLLSHLAEMKGGKLYLYAPYGHRSFVQKLVSKRDIEANVVSI